MASIKKLLNPSWQPRNGCDSRLMAQILIAIIIQVNLCCFLPVSLGLGTKLSLLICLDKNSQAVKQSAALFKIASIKCCEIQAGGQEMAVMVG